MNQQLNRDFKSAMVVVGLGRVLRVGAGKVKLRSSLVTTNVSLLGQLVLDAEAVYQFFSKDLRCFAFML